MSIKERLKILTSGNKGLKVIQHADLDDLNESFKEASFAQLMGNPKFKKVIENIEDIGDNKEPRMLAIKKKLMQQLKKDFDYKYVESIQKRINNLSEKNNMNTTTNIYRMSERIAKLANTNLLEVARGMSDDKTIINYCREKVVRTKLDNLLEKDIWDFVKRPTGDLYTKQNGAEKWFIKVQNNKVTRAKKTIDGVEYPLNTSIIQNFKKKMKLEAVKQRITITKTGDYPATYIKGKDVDTVFTVKLGDRGVIKSENNKGAFVWLDKSFETLVFVNKNNYR